MPRLIERSVTGCHECSYDRSQDATIARTIGRRMQRRIDRTIGRRLSRLTVHRSLIATTSRTMSYDCSCHRYSPIVAAGDRIKHCRSVIPWSNRNQSCDPEIVPSGVTVALAFRYLKTCVRVIHQTGAKHCTRPWIKRIGTYIDRILNDAVCLHICFVNPNI